MVPQHVERSSQEQARGGRQITTAIEQISNMVNNLNSAQRTQMRGGEQLLDAARRIEESARNRLTFGNIAVYDSALFRGLPRGVKLRMLPLYREWIAHRIVSGERYDGPWTNVGTPADLAALDGSLRSSL